MLADECNFDAICAAISAHKYMAVDCETTGLQWWKGHKLFSIIIATSEDSYYFNFQTYFDLDSKYVLKATHKETLSKLLAYKEQILFLHNAKFDMGMLRQEGIELGGTIHDTMTTARLLYNQHFDYSLEACAKRIELEKSSEVDEYISKHKLFTVVETPEGKKQKVPHFDKVPFDIISRYGMQDGRVTYALGMRQLADIEALHVGTPKLATIKKVYEADCHLHKTVFDMEFLGIKIDREYSQEAYYYECDQMNRAAAEFESLTGSELVDSGKALAAAFTKIGEKYPTTEKGNPSFTAEVLEGFTSPVAKVLLRYREALKLANTYYANFLQLSGVDDVLHCNLKLAGTSTGRLSASNPNLQNLSKENSARPFTVRRCFVPRPDFCFVMIDYQAMEYRMLLDLSEQLDVIADVKNGVDVHQATANQMRVSRSEGKILNFLLLYGGGAAKLASALGVELTKALELRAQYFKALPRVKKLSDHLINTAKQNKKLTNWAGFIYQFPDSEHCYPAPNHMIQGGCAQVVRFAMNDIAKLLIGKKSKMLLSIHDEVLLEIHKSELDLVAPIKEIMETTYPYNYLPLTCEVSHSWKSWADKIKGDPYAV